MKDKLTPTMILSKLEEKYELVDILTAIGIGLTTAMLYLKGKEKDSDEDNE